MIREVPGLGLVRGVEFTDAPNVEQYRGIPYGSIPARFRQSKLVTEWEDKAHDGTKFGPLCPFPRFVIGGSIVQKGLEQPHTYEMDEFKCLNLNVTAPKGPIPTDGYPVVVFIHGGGNVIGSGSNAEYDGRHLVEASIQSQRPVVSVTINYRLGVFGFMASNDILEDNEQNGDRGAGNYGLRDQFVAFQWVKRYISAFGGDPTRVTADGESAGSVDTHLLMCSELFGSEHPFSQAILQSGVAPLTVRTLKYQDSLYQRLVAGLKIDQQLSPQKRLQAIRLVSAEDIVNAYSTLGPPIRSWQATIDGYFLKDLPRFSTIAQRKYDESIQRLMIGNCAAEGTIFMDAVMKQNWTSDAVLSLIQEKIGHKYAARVEETYGLSPGMDQTSLLKALRELLSDAEWIQPSQAVAKSFTNGEVFYYHMDEGNPFEGPNQGRAHHAVDLLYIFLTYQDHLPPALKAMATTLVGHWLTFINGDQPWTPYEHGSGGTLMQYGPEAVITEVLEDGKSISPRLRLCEELQDSISTVSMSLRGEMVFE